MRKLILILSIFLLTACNVTETPENPNPDDNVVVDDNNPDTNPGDDTITCETGYYLDDETNTCMTIDEPVELGIESHDTIYQLLVYSFHDSDGDGVGDFKGIADKVDYFTYLGIDAIWLSPIHPSSSYHHYDVKDYYSADPLYEVDGFTFEDMVEVLNENGIDIILDMVVNHSSYQHPYFQEAINSFNNNGTSDYENYYILSNTSFTHPTLGYGSAYYNGVHYDAFYGVTSMPAFDFDYTPVREMFVDIFSHWLDKGVAGFRLDAAKHVYDNIQLNNEVFNYFVDELDKNYDDVYFVNEAWAGEGELIQYYQSGMSNLNFALKDQINNALLGSRDYGSYLQHFQQLIRMVNEDATEANFISNHDIGRLGEGKSLQEQKSIAALSILTPGNSYIYYGDETSLTGNYKLNSGYSGWFDSTYRTPFLWDGSTDLYARYIMNNVSAVRSAYTTSTTTVEMAKEDSSSLLNTYKTLIEIKNNLPILSTGTLSSVVLDSNLISYQVVDDNQQILIIHNLNNTSYQLENDDFLAIIGSVSQTTDPTLVDNTLQVPALSSIVIELNKELPVDHNQSQSTAFIRGTFNNWDISGNYIMSESNGVYTFELHLTEFSSFKIFHDDIWYGYDYVLPGDISIYVDPEYNNIMIDPGDYLMTFYNGMITIENIN